MQKGRMAIQKPDFVKYNFPKGGNHPLAKLCENDVRTIRRLRAEGWSQQKIADLVGIAQPNVSQVLLGRTWSHVK